MPTGGIKERGKTAVMARVVLVAVAGMLGCYLLAPVEQTEPPRAGHRIATAQGSVGSSVRLTEQVQELLARGGCPGWIALAGEPEVLSGSPRTDRADDALIPTAFQTEPPAPPTPDAASDDLLNGAEDLLKDRSDLLDRPAESLPAPSGKDDSDDLLLDRADLLTPEARPGPTPAAPAPPGRTAPTTQPASPKREGGLFAPPPGTTNPHADQPSTPTGTKQKDAKSDDNKDPHAAIFAETQYPSAETCRSCHENIYDEWSVSGHAYAAVSPMFHKFEQTIHKLTHGTIGYFCYRCHSPVGTALWVPRDTPLWCAPQVAREGVTCVACHRVAENYGKTNGERRIEPGDIYAPVYGSIGGEGVARAIAEKNTYKVKTSPDEKGPGQPIHTAGICFPQLSKSEFCTSCHQVAVHPGIKLEVVWEQYRASPACKKGVSCQDCHMGRIPGVASGYETGPAAVVNKKNVHPNRKHANHAFYGPGYSIAHPGVFPWNPKAKRWTMPEWLQFDWRAGWGVEAFEDAVEDGQMQVCFPEVWDNVDDRYDAREIIDDNMKKLAHKRHLRHLIFENSSHVDGPYFDSQPSRGETLRMHYVITNTNDGHNLPTASLGAQPQFWANVALIGPCGQRLWESGYTDRYGDLADIHSVDVRKKHLPFDWQLFNLQTMFLITGAKGTDREFPLPVNVDIDQLPFIRPGVQPIPLINHPPFIRMEGRSLAPLGSRRIPYKIPGRALQQPGRYRLSFRMRNRAEPIYFMRFCNSTPEMMRAMNEGILDVHTSSIEFIVK